MQPIDSAKTDETLEVRSLPERQGGVQTRWKSETSVVRRIGGTGRQERFTTPKLIQTVKRGGIPQKGKSPGHMRKKGTLRGPAVRRLAGQERVLQFRPIVLEERPRGYG